MSYNTICEFQNLLGQLLWLDLPIVLISIIQSYDIRNYSAELLSTFEIQYKERNSNKIVSLLQQCKKTRMPFGKQPIVTHLLPHNIDWDVHHPTVVSWGAQKWIIKFSWSGWKGRAPYNDQIHYNVEFASEDKAVTLFCTFKHPENNSINMRVDPLIDCSILFNYYQIHNLKLATIARKMQRLEQDLQTVQKKYCDLIVCG